MNDITMKIRDEIAVGDWVYVGQFRGRVVRLREFQGNTWVDVEISGVINPYLMSQIDTVEYYEAD